MVGQGHFGNIIHSETGWPPNLSVRTHEELLEAAAARFSADGRVAAKERLTRLAGRVAHNAGVLRLVVDVTRQVQHDRSLGRSGRLLIDRTIWACAFACGDEDTIDACLDNKTITSVIEASGLSLGDGPTTATIICSWLTSLEPRALDGFPHATKPTF